jgi:hypothetical protein
MDHNDAALIAVAQRRRLEGVEDGLDRHRLRAHERQQRRAIADGALTLDELAMAEAVRDAMGEIVAELRDDVRAELVKHAEVMGEESGKGMAKLREEIRKLECQLAELRGEIRGMRGGKILKPGD